MSTFVLLTRLAPEALRSPHSLEMLEEQVARAVREACPSVRWVTNLAVSGPYDYLDIFEAPTAEDAMKVAAVVRVAGHAHTELWPATEWQSFKSMVEQLPEEIGMSVVTH